MISLLLLDNFYPSDIIIDEFKGKGKRRIVLHGSVARYGPRISRQRKGFNIKSQTRVKVAENKVKTCVQQFQYNKTVIL